MSETPSVLTEIVPGVQPPKDVHRDVLSLITGTLEGAQKAGLTAFIPQPFGLIAQLILGIGIPAMKAKLLAEPVRERWTLDQIDERIAAVAEPQT